MTTDKTPSQISVVPCAVHFGGYIVSEQTADFQRQLWPDWIMKATCCGTEAEALAKKTELERGEIPQSGTSNAEASGSIRASAGSWYKEPAAAPLPAQTRPAITECSNCGEDLMTVGHFYDKTSKSMVCMRKPAKNPEPIEQAAPPRPLVKACCTQCGGVWLYDPAERFGIARELCLSCEAATEREPQRSEVKPNETQSQKAAAIEQARPPIRTHIVDAMGKCLPDCSGCTVRLFDGTIVGEQIQTTRFNPKQYSAAAAAQSDAPSAPIKTPLTCANCQAETLLVQHPRKEIDCWSCHKPIQIPAEAAALRTAQLRADLEKILSANEAGCERCAATNRVYVALRALLTVAAEPPKVSQQAKEEK